MGDAATTLLAGGIGLRAGGSIFQAQAAVQQAEASADAQKAAAEFNAVAATQAAAREEARLRRGGRRKLSSQRVKFAKSGVRLEGSPLQVLAQNAAEFEADALNARIAGENEARLQRQRGAVGARAARTRGRNLAGASLLTGATQASGLAIRALVRGA